jgi:hypothetical protein
VKPVGLFIIFLVILYFNKNAKNSHDRVVSGSIVF